MAASATTQGWPRMSNSRPPWPRQLGLPTAPGARQLSLPTWESSVRRAREGLTRSRLEGVLHSRKEPLAKGRAAFAVCGLLALGVLPALVLCRQAPMTEGAVPKIPKKPKAR